MPVDEVELARRKSVALEAIKRSLGTDAGASGATLFASHHLGELEQSYWQTHLNTDAPEPAQVLELLRLESHWSEEDDDGIETLDFCLPGGVSNYLISVRFDDDGAVDEISLES